MLGSKLLLLPYEVLTLAHMNTTGGKQLNWLTDLLVLKSLTKSTTMFQMNLCPPYICRKKKIRLQNIAMAMQKAAPKKKECHGRSSGIVLVPVTYSEILYLYHPCVVYIYLHLVGVYGKCR